MCGIGAMNLVPGQVRRDFVSKFSSNHDVNEIWLQILSKQAAGQFITLKFAPESEEGESQRTYNRLIVNLKSSKPQKPLAFDAPSRRGMREFQRPVLHSRKGVAECQEPTGEARGSAIGVRRSVSRASRMVVVVGGGGAVGSVSSTFFRRS